MQGREFIPFEWLSEVLFAAAHAVAGLAGVAVLTGLLFAAGVGLVYLAIARFGVPRLWRSPSVSSPFCYRPCTCTRDRTCSRLRWSRCSV